MLVTIRPSENIIQAVLHEYFLDALICVDMKEDNYEDSGLVESNFGMIIMIVMSHVQIHLFRVITPILMNETHVACSKYSHGFIDWRCGTYTINKLIISTCAQFLVCSIII